MGVNQPIRKMRICELWRVTFFSTKPFARQCRPIALASGAGSSGVRYVPVASKLPALLANPRICFRAMRPRSRPFIFR